MVVTVKDEVNEETVREHYDNIEQSDKDFDPSVQLDLRIGQSGEADNFGNSVSSAFVSEEFTSSQSDSSNS